MIHSTTEAYLKSCRTEVNFHVGGSYTGDAFGGGKN